MPLRLSVIIPTWNESAEIEATVGSALSAGADEVIVVDGGSRDDTVSIAEQLQCQVVRSAPGRGTQQNAGAEIAEGDILVFLHADNRLPQEAGEQIRSCFADSAVDFAAFQQRIDDDRWRFRWIERGNRFRARWLGLPYGDQCLTVRRSRFRELGGFPDVPLMEDVALSRALRRPKMLPGPLRVNARRWQRHGVIRQTLRNWCILTAYLCGVSPQRLANFYARHRE